LTLNQDGITLEANIQRPEQNVNIRAGGATSITSATGGVSLTNDANGSYITVGNSNITIDASANDQAVNIRGRSVNITTDTQGGNVTIQGDLTVSGTINGSTSSGITGTVPIEQGGTGATTAANARANLGIDTCADTIGSDYNVPNLGNNPQPIWIKNGVPTAMTGDVGSLYSPVCMIGGKIVECSGAEMLLSQELIVVDTPKTLDITGKNNGSLIFYERGGAGNQDPNTWACLIVPLEMIPRDGSYHQYWIARDGGSVKIKLKRDSIGSTVTYELLEKHYADYLTVWYVR